MSDLQVAPCSYEAAKFAVLKWHYSQSMPAGKLVKYGVWESGEYIGCILYGRGANSDLGKPYGLDQTEACELVRIALTRHETPVTQLVAETLRRLKVTSPGLRLVISFADPEQSHHGGIYQAGNWLYLGKSNPADEYVFQKRRWHGRSLRSHLKSRGLVEGTTIERARKIDPNAQRVSGSSKLRYVYPLDKAMRRKLNKLAQPYPQPADEGSKVSQQGSTL